MSMVAFQNQSHLKQSFFRKCVFNSLTHPHLAQIPVVVVRLILVGQLSAQNDAILPTLRTEAQTHMHTQSKSCSKI